MRTAHPQSQSAWVGQAAGGWLASTERPSHTQSLPSLLSPHSLHTAALVACSGRTRGWQTARSVIRHQWRKPLLHCLSPTYSWASSMADNALKVIGYFAMLGLLLIISLLAVAFSGLVSPSNVVVGTFVAILFEQPLFIPGCLIVLPSLLWKRSMFIGYSATLGVLLFAVWAIDEYQKQQAQYSDGGAAAAFGWALFLLLALSYALGAVVRVSIYATIMFIKSKQLKSASEKSA